MAVAFSAVVWLAFAGDEITAQQAQRWSVIPHPEVEIGIAFGEDEYMFQSIVSARFLPEGRIAVADGVLLEIRIYGNDGQFRKRVGRRGQGPGEFSRIGALWLTSRGMIAVWDPTNRRITTFDFQGNLRSTHRVAGNPDGGNLEVLLDSYDNDDIILASLFNSVRRPEPTPDRWLLGRFSATGEFKGSLGAVRGMWRFNRYALPFSPIPAATLQRDTLYLVDGYEAEISVRDARGIVARTITVPAAPAAAPDAIWSSLERQLQQHGKTLFIEYLQYQRVPRQNLFPQIAGLVKDDQGYIWVKAYDPLKDTIWLKANAMWPATGGEWRVIRSDGSLVARVQMPEMLRPLEISAHRILGVSIDTLGVERLVVHTLRR